jgi:hypothetical protein
MPTQAILRGLATLLNLWLATVLLCAGAQAQTSLPPKLTVFAGSFEVGDIGVPERCIQANSLAGSCACPGSTQAAYTFRAISDTGTNAAPHGGVIKVCSPGSMAASSEFAGAYQVDDPIAGSRGCRVKNQLTDACSCPAGSVATPWRVVADHAGGRLGSTIHACVRPDAKAVAFAGSYQTDAPSTATSTGATATATAAATATCRSPNPFTRSCSCPSGFNAQPHRVLADHTKALAASAVYTCVPPVAAQHLCPGLLPSPDADLVDPSGNTPAHEAFQSCLNAQPAGAVLEIPVGNYRIDRQLKVTGPKTLRTQGTSAATQGCLGTAPCATLFAGPQLREGGGMLAANATPGVVFEHVVLDGNRMARIGSAAYKECKAGKNGYGFNAKLTNCKGCAFNYSASINALCGTGLEWRGDDAVIQHSIFAGNGNHFDTRAWADGLTLLQSDNAKVADNQFIDNSDIGFIMGGGKNAVVKNNLVQQRGMRAFAGFMLDNFNGGTSGDFKGTVVSGNKVQCDQDKCLYGMNLGPHAWYQSRNISGGSVVDNVINGGVIALNVDGAGTPADAVHIQGNTLTTEGSPTIPDTPACKKLRSTPFSVSSDSELTAGSTKPALVQDINSCVGRTQW